MIIMKFGGSSLQTVERIREVAAIIQKHLDRAPLVVLSAMGETTNHLLEAGTRALSQRGIDSKIESFHREILKALDLPYRLIEGLFLELHALLKGISLVQELTGKTRDALVSYGERLSCVIFSAYLNQVGISSCSLTGWEAGIVTTSDFTKAEVLPESYDRIRAFLKRREGVVPVITGFIAKDQEGHVTTLGRGGSDLTASVIGKALHVEEIQLWKDVDGILTADPRLVPKAHPVVQLSFAEASELAYFGAKVLHPSAILPAMCASIPVRVKNHRDPYHPGTLIINTSSESSSSVVAIAHKSHLPKSRTA